MTGDDRRPGSRSFVDVPAGNIHVRDDGPPDAPVVVLIHGFASSVHWFDRLVPLLTDRYRVVRMDLLGHGLTVARDTDLGAEAQAAMVLAVLTELGIETFTPVGHSFGSDVAIGLAERSGRTERLVLIGQAPDYDTATFPPGRNLTGFVPVARALQGLSALLPARAGGIGFARGFRADRAFIDRTQSGADLRVMDPRMFRTVLIDRERDFRTRPLDLRLRELDLPALVVLGGRDQMYPLAPTRARYDAVPNVRVEVIAESGHSPNVETPDALAALLRGFL